MMIGGGKGGDISAALHAPRPPPANSNPATHISILVQVQPKMKLTLVAFAILAAIVAVSAQHPCYSKDQDSCKQDSNCAYNFVHSCCSPSNGPVCAHHASFVHSIPQVYPTSVNHPITNKPLAPGPPVVVHHPVVHHPIVHPHYPYHPHPLVYSKDKKNSNKETPKLRAGKKL